MRKLLYVADSGKTKRIYVFDGGDGGVLTGSRVFAVIDQGGPDGIRCDSKGGCFRVPATACMFFPRMESGSDGSLFQRRRPIWRLVATT